MKRILFFQQGRFSGINESVYRGLRSRFPYAEILWFDVNNWIKARPWIIVINILAACWDYGLDILFKKRSIDDSFFGTRYMFHRARRFAIEIHKKWPADFSFQTQSMYDFSAPGTPHFVYTDHTYKSSSAYPDYGKVIWSPVRPDWLINIERSIYDNAKGIFTFSQNVKNTLLKKYGIPEKKILCVGGGPNVSFDLLNKIPIESDRYRAKKIIFVGKDWKRKGGPELLKSFRLAREVHKDTKLTIVGCNPHINDTTVDVVGEIQLDKVLRYYADSSIFCMPTRNEPFGVVFLEAFAAGLPIVALKLGAAPDFVLDDKTGILVDPGDVQGLARALTDLLNDPEKCRTFGKNGRSLVMQNYTWEHVFEKIDTRISEICNRR